MPDVITGSGVSPVPPLKVFLSHSMKDTEHVEQVREQLLALGIEVWLAENDPRPGASILAKIESEMPKCDAVVFLITTNSVDSAYVQQEVGMARRSGVPMVPLVDARVDRGRLGLLGELEWVEINLDEPGQAFAKVTRTLQPLIVKQAQQVAAQGATAKFVIDIDDPATALLLIGLGVVLGMLLVGYGTKAGVQ